MESFTPKQRMLNACRGVFSDRLPVAPEFWYLFPARVLGVSMVEFERELPFWQSLQTVFRAYDCEGWGAAFPETENEDLKKTVSLKKLDGSQYRETTVIDYRGAQFESSKIFDLSEPSWAEKHLAEDPALLGPCIDLMLSGKNVFDFGKLNAAYERVGGDYLLEVWLGVPFFDFISELTGFERAVMLFSDSDEKQLEAWRERLIEYQLGFIREACQKTRFESFVLGCSYSCNSLIGPAMWRKWDKPYITRLAEELHHYGRLMHIHFHGKSMETAADFPETGVDCVCPFERPPGGDVEGLQGLQKLRGLLGGRVTMNGNVHTVETLIRGSEAAVRREVRQIREAFEGCARVVIGTGDQVGAETPEENIRAMIEEAKIQHP